MLNLLHKINTQSINSAICKNEYIPNRKAVIVYQPLQLFLCKETCSAMLGAGATLR